MKRIIAAFHNSVAAFRHLIAHEAAFKQECLLLLVALPVGYLVASSWVQFSILMLAIVFIIIVEVLNTAVEAVCDAVSPDFDANIKIAKDCGSFAVLIACAIAGMVWLFAIINWLFP